MQHLTNGREIKREAGEAVRWAAPRQKHVAAALGVSRQRVSQEANGDGRVARFYECVRQLVVEGRTDAGSVIAGAMCVAEEAALSLPSDEIRRRLADALSQEALFEGSEENVAQLRLATALGTDGSDLRAALVAFDAATRREMGAAVNALVYARALMHVRGWRTAPGGR